MSQCCWKIYLVPDQELDGGNGGVEVRLDPLQELDLLLGCQEVDGAVGGDHDRVRQLVPEQPGLKLHDFAVNFSSI